MRFPLHGSRSCSLKKHGLRYDATLLRIGAGPWVEVPLWVPEGDAGGLLQVDVRKAIAWGLRFRPVERTVSDTLAWHRTRSAGHQWAAGMSRERETDLLRRASGDAAV